MKVPLVTTYPARNRTALVLRPSYLYVINNSSCSTRDAVRLRCGELRPSLHGKGLLFIARASRLYRPRPRARPRGHGELLKLLRRGLFGPGPPNGDLLQLRADRGHVLSYDIEGIKDIVFRILQSISSLSLIHGLRCSRPATDTRRGRTRPLWPLVSLPC